MLTRSITLSALLCASSSTLAQQKPLQKDEQDIETLVITATPMERTILESATPVSVLGREELRQQQSPTLGETLKSVPGVHSTYFGPVSSSPVIRGLDGPRIKIVQNGLDASDASRVGPDHLVSTETSNATQIEVLRGPATLLYGSGAIGGVVNVVDNRLPTIARDGVEGEISYLHDTVSNEDSFATNLDGGAGNFAWHFDAFSRKTDDYEIPSAAEIDADEDENTGVLENSFIDAQGFTMGAGWVTDDLKFALSYGKLKNEYGIPGHGHEEEHDEAHEEEGHIDSHEDEHAEEDVFARLDQDRFQALVDWTNLDGFIQDVYLRSAYTDYTHAEIEEGEVGTRFNNESFETRLWAKHRPVYGWEGVLGLNIVESDFEAIGEEAFTAPSETQTAAIFFLEQKRTGDFLWQLGARLEQIDMTPDNAFFEHDEAEHEAEEHEQEIVFNTLSYTARSLSAGVVWQLQNNQSLSFNWARSERAPSAGEIFANGPHIGTNSYEIGLGFDIEVHEEHDDYEIIQAESNIREEVSNNFDLTFRRGGEHIELSLSAFFNNIDDYVFAQNTGLFTEDAHEHEEAHEDELEEEHNEEGELPVFLFQQQDAQLYGFEAEIDWHINEQIRLDTFADYTRAKLDNGGNVPRIPPLRVGASFHYESTDWHAELGAIHYFKQDNIAESETVTDGYTLVHASANYYTSLLETDMVIFFKANNLTDQEARVHTSFLKDEAPLPGRSFVLGARVDF